MKLEFLLIDDDEITIMLSEILLEDFPEFIQIKTFSDGLYALDYLKNEYCESTKYIISLDINMPLMNGWEFLEEITPFVSVKNTMVFMLSSSTDKEDMDRAAGIAPVKSFFSKPLDENHLKEITAFLALPQ